MSLRPGLRLGAYEIIALIQEARASAALNYPGILAVYDIGTGQ